MDPSGTADGMWNPGGRPALVPGVVGGSGRLGDFVVAAGEVLVLGSDGSIGGVQQIFGPGLDTLTETYFGGYVVDNYDPAQLPGTGQYSADSDFVGGAGADGVFEFTSLRVEQGGRIELQGEAPVRVFCRGDLVVEGEIDVSGGSAAEHFSDGALGQVGAHGGPGGGSGGRGGDRFDHGQGQMEFLAESQGGELGGLGDPGEDPNLVGIANPGAVIDGGAGEGVGGGASALGGGGGGVHWPDVFPGHDATPVYVGSVMLFGGAQFADFVCQSPQGGAPGGGGVYALPAGPEGVGQATNPLLAFGDVEQAPPTPAGDASQIVPGTLNPETGQLRGGSGGGGGGTGIVLTHSTGNVFDCQLPSIGPLRIDRYADHSGAAGGGGGGAIQAQAGRQLTLAGRIDAGGGDGGSPTQDGDITEDYFRFAAPGGGGSGGALLLQAYDFDVAPLADRLDVEGGAGGGEDALNGDGGDGGPGLLRLEAPAGSGVDLAALENGLVQNGELSPAGVPEIASSGTLDPAVVGPGAFSGARSCWMQPAGPVNEVWFVPDQPGGQLGWDMDVLLAGVGEVSFREPDIVAPGLTLEDVLGNFLRDPDEVTATASPIVVRFQGARVVGPLDDPCAGEALVGPGGPIVAESVTPWVYHPVELNDYWVQVLGATPEAEARRPNAVRFQVIFDQAVSIASAIDGVTNLAIQARVE